MESIDSDRDGYCPRYIDEMRVVTILSDLTRRVRSREYRRELTRSLPIVIPIDYNLRNTLSYWPYIEYRISLPNHPAPCSLSPRLCFYSKHARVPSSAGRPSTGDEAALQSLHLHTHAALTSICIYHTYTLYDSQSRTPKAVPLLTVISKHFPNNPITVSRWPIPHPPVACPARPTEMRWDGRHDSSSFLSSSRTGYGLQYGGLYSAAR